MMANCCFRRKGYTLLELLLAMAVFVSLAGGLSYAIIRTINAHNFETSYREATLQTRNALSQMIEELRVASVPQDLQAQASNQYAIPSAVWFPDAYGNGGSVAGYGLALEKRTVKIDGNEKQIDVYKGYNRLVFTRSNPNYRDGDSLDEKYVFVDWFVSTTKPNRLYRVVRKLTMSSPPYQFGAGKYRFANPESFLGNGGDKLGSLAFQTGKARDFIVVQLPGPYDRICFAVEHNANESIYASGVSGVRDKNNALYDPNLFNIVMKSTVYDKSIDKKDIATNSSNDPNLNPDNNPYIDPTDPDRNDEQSITSNKRVIVYKEQAHISH
ncbi:MAG: type II secretion system protein [bacterium]|nr:type II secretion system protein [bacterium]